MYLALYKRFILRNINHYKAFFHRNSINLFMHFIFLFLFPFRVQERNFTLKSRLNRAGPGGNKVKEIDLVPFENYI